jgi:hypothetical protein
LLFWVALFQAWPGLLLAQTLPVQNYGTPQYKLEPQNWQVAELPDGRIAVANDGGLLVFDGANWQLLEEDLNYAGRSVCRIGARVFAGGEDVFGYLSADSAGRIHLISLTNELPDSLRTFGFVHQIAQTEKHTVFQASENVFLFNQDLHLEQTFQFNRKIEFFFAAQKSLYVYLADSGLFALHDGVFLPVTGRSIFKRDPVVGMATSDVHHLLVFTKGGLVFNLHINDYGYEMRTVPSDMQLPVSTLDKSLRFIYSLPDSFYIMGFNEGGGLVWNSHSGKSIPLDKNTGLRDDHFEHALLDSRGLLWLSMNSGVASVLLHYPVLGYGPTQGLEGSIESIDKHKNLITASTSDGLFVVDAAKRERFFSPLPLQTWDVCSFDTNNLLIATNNDISRLDDDNLQPIIECYPWKLKKSEIDPLTLWIGLDPGITALRKAGDGWQYSQIETRVDQPINKIFEDPDKQVWFGSSTGGIFRSAGFVWHPDSLEYPNLTWYGEEHGLPAGQVHLTHWMGQHRFATSNGYFTLHVDTFLPDTTLSVYPTSPLVHRIYTSPRNEMWSVSYTDNGHFRIGFFSQPDTFQYRIFNPISREIFHSIYFDGDSLVWIGGPAGAYCYNRQETFDIDVNYTAHITNVSIMDDSSIFHGHFLDSTGQFCNEQGLRQIPSFYYKTNNISFQFSALSRGDAGDVRYSHILEGFDEKWSNWSGEVKKEYTNLPPGTYTFRVKARDIFETQSREARYSFVIEKPWYQTTWYYLGQASFLLMLILVTVFLNHSGEGGEWSAIITFVTIITIFEFLILLLDPFIDQYADEVPIFKLVMNILLAISLNPAEHFIKGWIARRKGKDYVKD